MTSRFFILLLLLPFASGDGDDDGRRGNAFYAEGQFDLAVESYERGLAGLSADASPLVRYGLLNNLGSALLRSGDAKAAGEAFARALNSAPAPADVARTAYNAGNAAFAAQELEAALDQYRKSLLADPTNEDAKFNYEFVKRRLQQQQEQQQQQQGDQQNQDQQEQEQEDQEQQGEQEQEEGSQNPEQQEGGSEQEQEGTPSEQEDQRQGQQEPSPTDLSEEQAEQILEALQNEEEQLLRQVQRPKSRPRRVEKDW